MQSSGQLVLGNIYGTPSAANVPRQTARLQSTTVESGQKAPKSGVTLCLPTVQPFGLTMLAPTCHTRGISLSLEICREQKGHGEKGSLPLWKWVARQFDDSPRASEVGRVRLTTEGFTDKEPQEGSFLEVQHLLPARNLPQTASSIYLTLFRLLCSHRASDCGCMARREWAS
jgi:hypothetical protein